ncbi:MAG: hypothetical protein ACPGWS_06200, partial [Solirubrobacterales bacterium]
EFGHELRKRIAKGKPGAVTLRGKRATRRIGHVDAKPFMRPAFDRKHKESARLFFKHLGTETERVARRFARQAERGKLSRGAKRAFKVTV